MDVLSLVVTHVLSINQVLMSYIHLSIYHTVHMTTVNYRKSSPDFVTLKIVEYKHKITYFKKYIDMDRQGALEKKEGTQNLGSFMVRLILFSMLDGST